MLNNALNIIQDEHRRLAAVVRAMIFLVREIREKGMVPDFKLQWAIIYYIDAFPTKLHHPRENAYLFRKLRARTYERDAVLDELERQHIDGAKHVKALELALGHYEAGSLDGLEQFGPAVEQFGTEIGNIWNWRKRLSDRLLSSFLPQRTGSILRKRSANTAIHFFGANPTTSPETFLLVS